MASKLKVLCFSSVHYTDGSFDPPEMKALDFPDWFSSPSPEVFKCPKCKLEIGIGIIDGEDETIQ